MRVPRPVVATHEDGRVERFSSSTAAAKHLRVNPTSVRANAQNGDSQKICGWSFEIDHEPNEDADEVWRTSDDGLIRLSSAGRVQTRTTSGTFGNIYRPEVYGTRSPRVRGLRFAEMVFKEFCSPSLTDLVGLSARALRVVPKDGDWLNLAAKNLKCVSARARPNATSFKRCGSRAHCGKPKQRVVSYRDGQRRVHASQCHCARDMTEVLTKLKAEGKFHGNPVCHQGGVRKCVIGKMRVYKGFLCNLE